MKVSNILAVLLLLVMCCIDSTSMMPFLIVFVALIVLGTCMLTVAKMESKKKEEQPEMTYMEEITQNAYDTAESFEGIAPPQGSLYIGSGIKNGDRTRYWRHDDGTLYKESAGEANLKRKAAREHRGNEKDRQT